ncbi:metabolite traffic protein EboE [Snuella sedimenti]|uniref:Metabolite traffic protein EboE n=1 Tax=Snuella sedimenti TaxID=2798802 RepID=A0A8J7J0B4_9FLAO|nr:metabolite traffic protein EboE [Snuella sedimenti]MBJ6366659.1 metabolite traffic protein EboE [Snuella sedimenti]
MIIKEHAHLTYCTNIHSGETWEAVFNNLKQYTVNIKKQLTPHEPFGIGLRLSQESASTLLETSNLSTFKAWLKQEDLYVFTINGFPYGAFHNVVIKDQVHTPDWTTTERLQYTKDLMTILAELLPESMDGSVSTSPLSYKHWFEDEISIDSTKKKACASLVEVVLQLVAIKHSTGKLLHLDLEPEPDGFLENTQEVIDFFNDYLLKDGLFELQKKLNCPHEAAKQHLLDHIQVCYDVCHFALAYESPQYVISQLKKEGIKIGKVQISAAIKCEQSNTISIEKQQAGLRPFDEPTYLHQSIVKLDNGSLLHFSDLNEGIDAMGKPNFKEIRTHFHVPIFISKFSILQSTQDEIIKALELWKETQYSNHLEVETYTWSILPKTLQTDLTSSITRELEWVQKQLLN